MKGADNIEILVLKKVTGHRTFLGDFIHEKWRTSCGGGGSLMTLLSLDAVLSLAPWGVCTWSLSERACQFVIIIWLVERETSYTSLRMCRNILKCVSKSSCGFLRFGQPSTSIFLWVSKSIIFPIVQTVLKNTIFQWLLKKSRWTVILKNVENFMKTIYTMGKMDLWNCSCFLSQLLFKSKIAEYFSCQ